MSRVYSTYAFVRVARELPRPALVPTIMPRKHPMLQVPPVATQVSQVRASREACG
jgi:hypothetical protein